MLTRIAGAGCAAFIALVSAMPALADNRSRAEAFRMADGSIEVVADFSENQLYWCGASQAARNLAEGRDRIYVLRGPAPSQSVPGRVAVRFGLTPPAQVADGAAGLTNSVDVVGNSLTLAQALQTCNERSVSQ